jgi:hypothetical protein
LSDLEPRFVCRRVTPPPKFSRLPVTNDTARSPASQYS